jgi:hydrogenase maturation protein HypF
MNTSVIEGRRIELRGTVQGVGMRPWIYRIARAHGVTGRVWNQVSGVTIEAFADRGTLEAFVRALEADSPPAAVIDTLDAGVIPPEHAEAFVIIESSRGAGRRVSIPPDLATCADCAAEIADPSDRRFRYPFSTCTNCGPRFTIATDVPYDRSATTMARFTMCPACQREYDDPLDRRFHAEPNACRVCGPRLAVNDSAGHPIDTPDAISVAAAAIAAGRIVAVKGIGGFHLACDATSSSAVATLRARKHRDEKPFAVMVRDTAAAQRLAEVGQEAQRLLESIERPIVLVPRRPDACLAPEVAPRNPLIGLMLPYTPVHHLLLADAARPLVMTSGNLSDESIVFRNEEAVMRLGRIADLLLVHDREIVTRCDDSVATIVAGAPMILRRSRGFVPRAIALRDRVHVPVLACGALLKNTFCLAHGDRAWLGPHIGDLENAGTYEAFQDAIERMERFLGVRGELIAHDLHPDYLSTRYAQARSADAIGVPHHHAHVASAIAEHGIDRPVIGVAFDGTGYGPDGTAWGGEFLVGGVASARRAATWRPLLLAGGDAAIRRPWRIALALLADAFGDDAPLDGLALFRQLTSRTVAGVRQMLDARLLTPAARGVGRYFDAFGSLVLARPDAQYEGQIAFELNMAAEPNEDGRYEYAIDVSTSLPEIDFRPVTRGAVGDLLRGVAPSIVSARFHNTVVAATASVVRDIARTTGGVKRQAVVLTGGCFQNARLAEGVQASVASQHDVFLHRRVPPGDGGIALGQAVIAAAISRGR